MGSPPNILAALINLQRLATMMPPFTGISLPHRPDINFFGEHNSLTRRTSKLTGKICDTDLAVARKNGLVTVAITISAAGKSRRDVPPGTCSVRLAAASRDCVGRPQIQFRTTPCDIASVVNTAPEANGLNMVVSWWSGTASSRD